MAWGKLLIFVSPCALFSRSILAVTVYDQNPLGATKTLPLDASHTDLPAYDSTTLTAPDIEPIPGPYSFQLTNDVNAVCRVSSPVNGTFYGFPVGVSVMGRVCGSTRTQQKRKDKLNAGG